ncbi:MAG TPA: type II toxin-antitoxin system RelE/ParE family toxin [Thermoanaerobaculia bacterium]|jgi:mRNA interferase RelE/StbE
MSWDVEYTNKFLKELSRLPPEIQERAERIAFEELEAGNPFELGYLERLTDYPGKYKVRLGQYRMGIEIDKKNRRIVCRRVAHRKDIYRIFP